MDNIAERIREVSIAVIREENPHLSTFSATHVWAAMTVLARSELARVFADAAANSSWVFAKMVRTDDSFMGVSIGGASWRFVAEAVPFPRKPRGNSEAFFRVHEGVVPDVIELGAMAAALGADAAAEKLLARVGVLCTETVVGHC